MPLRRATLPSGSLCLSSELVRFQAARALLADVLATKDLPSNVRCALKKVGDLINPDSIHGGLDAFNTPPSDINFPHCGDRIAVHEVNFHFPSKQHRMDACWPASISKRTYMYIYMMPMIALSFQRTDNCLAENRFSTGRRSAMWSVCRKCTTTKRQQPTTKGYVLSFSVCNEPALIVVKKEDG
ncbi:probable 3',5'-cyclic phosphodiesterase pde-3 [Trichinella spiralis]|uniref:probable 3',5'-cyclic phosphodiesterase pde-3 n=1 Tax=Trichinella spiralis TaxID=6334 RepID=UPI0001EFEC27|nr:probable 3',5'-cyclic phosphodiesterase pde-3 [Trichinella spiralis]